ncbi:MAG TPA: FAD-dependent oxidoreductase, partial [Acidocella sp.]|nr:FAD-dependent oxidoreductase [Acidocella sp.]
SCAPEGVLLELTAGEPIRGSHLLVAAGRRPNVDELRLDLAGVVADQNGINVDAYRRTSRKHIFAIGDCRAGPRFTHAAGRDGALVTRTIGFGLPARAHDDTLPGVIFTDPELAQVGLTEEAARARHGHVRVLRAFFSENDRALVDDDADGFIKVIRAGPRIVGVTLVGASVGELVLPWTMLLGKASLWSLFGTVVPYPTRSELSKAVAFAAYEPIVFSRKARAWAQLLARLRRP